MNPVYIVDGVRTPIGKLGGSLAAIRTDDLASFVISALLKRVPSLDPAAIEEVVLGCANQAGEDNRNVARMAALLAGLPTTVPGVTLNRLCASGLNAVAYAAFQIGCGAADLVIAGGVEGMSRSPYVLSKAESPLSRGQELIDTTLGWRFINPRMRELHGVHSMGETAENVAIRCGISRESQDIFAVGSHTKAANAQRSGRLTREIVSVPIPSNPTKKSETQDALFEHDEFIKADTTVERLSALKPAFSKAASASVTAGNSSGLNDGACALLCASAEAVKRYNLTPLARFVGAATVGCEPAVMGLGPIEATRKVLNRNGLTLASISVIELNEAFAAQALACLRALGIADDDTRVNRNGGAIALGHPLGMSGARLVLTAMLELQETKEANALCTMCVGVGQGMAMVLERA